MTCCSPRTRRASTRSCTAARTNRDTLRELNTAHRLFSQLRARRDVVETRRRLGELEAKFLEIVAEWGASIESKDNYTSGHCDRVADYACKLARMAGLDRRDALLVPRRRAAARRGQADRAVQILNKPGPLTAEERALMERHPAAGEKMLAGIEFPVGHEADGPAPPRALGRRGVSATGRGRVIPLSARIVCIADVLDALVTDRPYRPAFTRERAREIMQADVGAAFDPALFKLFLAILDQRSTPLPPPSFVRALERPQHERVAV